MLSEVPDSTEASRTVALTCYLSAVVAMAKSMREICSRAGLLYGDRLIRLPRRLGFDTTAEKLEESRQALESDLAEYTAATSAWLDAGSRLAHEIVADIDALDPCITESQDLHTAMLEDLAQQMSVSAEVDADSDLREDLSRYALGLRSYLQRRRNESRSSLKDLQTRAQHLAEWLARADPATSTDLATGLPNREEFVRRLQACWQAFSSVSALVFEWKPPQAVTRSAADAIAKQLADRLADFVRPRDIVGRWADNRFAVIFDCPGEGAGLRASRLAAALADRYPVLTEGAATTVEVYVTVAMVERLPGETVAQLIGKIEELVPAEPAIVDPTALPEPVVARNF